MVIPLRHFLVDDAAAGGHPLHITCTDHAGVAQAVAMLHFARQHIGDGFNPAVGMPGKARGVIRRVIPAKIIQQQEWVKEVRVAKSKSAPQMHPRAFQGGPAGRETLYFSSGAHFKLLPVLIKTHPGTIARVLWIILEIQTSSVILPHKMDNLLC